MSEMSLDARTLVEKVWEESGAHAVQSVLGGV